MAFDLSIICSGGTNGNRLSRSWPLTFPSSVQEVEPLISCAVVLVILAACASWIHVSDELDELDP